MNHSILLLSTSKVRYVYKKNVLKFAVQMNKKHNFLEEKKTNCEYTVFHNAFLTFTTIIMIMNYNTYKLYKYLLMHSVLRLKKGAISNLCLDFLKKQRFL